MADDYQPRTRRQTLGIGVACLLLAVLLGGGGWLVIRGITSPTSPTAAELTTPSSTADELALGVPGFVDGVPWGFALDPAGATAAGITVVTVTGQPEVAFDPDRFDQVAEVMFTAEQAQLQAELVAAARTQFELSGWAAQPVSRRMYHLAPLAVRLTSFDAERLAASVEVWAMTLVGVGDAGAAVFTTSTVDVAGDATTWTVTGVDTVEGPTPLVHTHASAPGRTRALLRESVATWPLPRPAEERP